MSESFIWESPNTTPEASATVIRLGFFEPISLSMGVDFPDFSGENLCPTRFSTKRA